MYCRNCGANCPDNMKFCPNCGASLAAPGSAPGGAPYQQQNPYQQNPYSTPNAPAPYAPPTSITPASLLTWGILGLAFACSFYLSFLGIIFSCVARKKANQFLVMGGRLQGKAKVGYNLAKAGLIVGIILTVIFVIYLFIAAGALVALFHNYPHY